MAEAFQAAGVGDEEANVEGVINKVVNAAFKHSQKFTTDERASQKMTASQSKAFLGEFVETLMGAFSGFLHEKHWFEKISWNGVLLVVAFHTFQNGKIFTRIMKPEIISAIDDALLAWSEEERVVKGMWAGIEAAGFLDNHRKKVNQHLMRAYDEAHFNAPYGSIENASLSPDVAALQEFVKGWMSSFADKAYSQLQNGLQSTSGVAQVAALAVMFQTLMDPNSPCLPIQMQSALPPAPWSYIEECATQVIAEAEASA